MGAEFGANARRLESALANLRLAETALLGVVQAPGKRTPIHVRKTVEYALTLIRDGQREPL